MKINCNESDYELIESFIKSKFKSVNSFCENQELYIYNYYRNLKLVEEENPELYKKYLLHLEMIKQEQESEKYQRKINELEIKLESCKTNLANQEAFYDFLIKMLSSTEIEQFKIKQSIHYSKLLYGKYQLVLDKQPLIKKIFINAFNKEYLLNDEEMVTTARAVISRIRLGIIKNNEIRDFNLLDYTLMTDIPLLILIPTIKSLGILTISDHKKLSALLDQYRKYLKGTDEQHCYENIMKNNIYNGDGRLLADQNTKEKIVEFLERNKITLKYYKLALYAYLNGEIDLNRVYDKEIPNNIRSKIKKANLGAIKEILELKQKSDIYLKYQREFQESSMKYQEALNKRL